MVSLGRGRKAAVVVGTCSLVAVLCLSMGQCRDTSKWTDRMLTVEETVGLLSHYPGDELDRNANPAAKDTLYRLLESDALPYRSRIWDLIGFIGEREDIQRVESWFKARTGVLSLEERTIGRSAINSLAIMGVRGVDGAVEKLRAMADADYWRQMPFEWYEEKEVARVPAWGYEGVWLSVMAYASTEAEGLDEVVRRAMASAEKGSALAGMADAARKTRRAARKWDRIKWAKGPRPKVNPELHACSEDRYWAVIHPHLVAMEAEGHPTRELLDRDKAGEVIRQAMAAYYQTHLMINTKFLNSQILRGRLLVDGQLIPPERRLEMRPHVSSLFRDPRLNVLEASPGAFRLTYDSTWYMGTLWDGQSEKTVGPAEEDITVTFALPNTRELGRYYFPDKLGTRTIAPDGTLIVYMRKIDGRWYWNPFGW